MAYTRTLCSRLLVIIFNIFIDSWGPNALDALSHVGLFDAALSRCVRRFQVMQQYLVQGKELSVATAVVARSRSEQALMKTITKKIYCAVIIEALKWSRHDMA
jgi:hypothetical protein